MDHNNKIKEIFHTINDTHMYHAQHEINYENEFSNIPFPCYSNYHEISIILSNKYNFNIDQCRHYYLLFITNIGYKLSKTVFSLNNKNINEKYNILKAIFFIKKQDDETIKNSYYPRTYNFTSYKSLIFDEYIEYRKYKIDRFFYKADLEEFKKRIFDVHTEMLYHPESKFFIKSPEMMQLLENDIRNGWLKRFYEVNRDLPLIKYLWENKYIK